MPDNSKPSGGYPVHNEELAAILLALGFRLQRGGVATFYSEDVPKSAGGEKVWLFEGYSDGCSAVTVQRAYENCGDGREMPEPFAKFNQVLEEIDALEELPPHIRARFKAALQSLMPEIAAACAGLFAKHLVTVHNDVMPPFTKVKTGPNSYEVRPMKPENC